MEFIFDQSTVICLDKNDWPGVIRVAGKVRKGKAEAAGTVADVPETDEAEIEEIPVSEVLGQTENTEDTSASEESEVTEGGETSAEEEGESISSGDGEEPEAEHD